MSKFLIVRPLIDNEKISTKDQWEYKLDVGMLLYLVKHLHLNLANAMREKRMLVQTLLPTRNSYRL